MTSWPVIDHFDKTLWRRLFFLLNVFAWIGISFWIKTKTYGRIIKQGCFCAITNSMKERQPFPVRTSFHWKQIKLNEQHSLKARPFYNNISHPCFQVETADFVFKWQNFNNTEMFRQSKAKQRRNNLQNLTSIRYSQPKEVSQNEVTFLGNFWGNLRLLKVCQIR